MVSLMKDWVLDFKTRNPQIKKCEVEIDPTCDGLTRVFIITEGFWERYDTGIENSSDVKLVRDYAEILVQALCREGIEATLKE
jgi:hypothetical protein